ncbi:NAD-dependent epimerase/dehydratase family protein [Verrucomicrobiota bacterium sgz303538]
MNRTVLITGVAGFLGRTVAREFSRAGWHVLGVDDSAPENASLPTGARYHRARLPHPSLAELIRETSPQACVHCAGRASVPLSLQDPAADFNGNTALTFELLNTLRQHAPQCRFLFLSSAAVYGNPATLPVCETHPTAPLSPYGYHKLQSELLCEEFTCVYGLPTAAVRIFSAYGPGLRRQVIWDICAKLLNGGDLRLYGTGRESRDFIHAVDVAKALVLLAERAPCDGERYNLASGQEVTIAELFNQLALALDRPAQPIFDGQTRAGDPLNWRADVGRLQTLGFQPSVSLDHGLRGVAAWASAELLGS